MCHRETDSRQDCKITSGSRRTNCADDASVACSDGLRVDVQQAHVLQEGVGRGSVELLCLDEGRAHVYIF